MVFVLSNNRTDVINRNKSYNTKILKSDSFNKKNVAKLVPLIWMPRNANFFFFSFVSKIMILCSKNGLHCPRLHYHPPFREKISFIIELLIGENDQNLFSPPIPAEPAVVMEPCPYPRGISDLQKNIENLMEEGWGVRLNLVMNSRSVFWTIPEIYHFGLLPTNWNIQTFLWIEET